MRNVIILGGIGTKKTHIKKLIDLYTNLNLNPIFYQAEGVLGNHLYRPKKFKEKSLKIIKKIEISNEPYIIHSFSGSNWLAYDINSHKKAQTIRGEGDGEAVSIYADAFGRDEEFFTFYRSMEAYKKSFGQDDTMVINPTGDFFKFFQLPAE